MNDSIKAGPLQKSGLINIFLSGLNAFLTLLALVLVAKNFGGSKDSDSYFFLLSISTLFTNLITCTFGTVFLPTFIELKIKYGATSAEHFASKLLLCFLIIVLLLGAIPLFFYETFYLMFSRFSLDQILASKGILSAFSAVFILSVLAEFFKSLAQALGRFVMAAIGALFQPVSLILLIIFSIDSLREDVLPLSLIISRIIMLGFMFYIAVIAGGVRLSLNSENKLGLKQFFKVASPYWSANLVTSFALFFFDYLASGLGVGVITAVSYAQKIFALPTQLVIAPLMEIARTEFSKFQALNDQSRFHRLYAELTAAALLISVPISVFIFFNSELIISALFERGSFTSSLTQIASDCLKIFAIAIPFNCLFTVNGRAAESFQRLGWISLVGTIGNLSLIGLTYLFVWQYEFIGIPAARLTIEIIYFSPFGFIAVYMLSGALPVKNVLKFFCIAALFSMASIEFMSLLPNLHVENKLGNLILTCIFFSCAYLLFISMIYFPYIYKFLKLKINEK